MRLFDLHCDTLTSCYDRGASLCCNDLHVDLHRGLAYSPWCQLFAVWIPDTLRGAEAFRFCNRVLTFAHEEEKRYPQQFALVKTTEQLQSAVKLGCCAGILTVENGAAVAGELENIRLLSARGVRVMTLTWNGENEWGNGCLSKNTAGLTEFGKRAVAELYRVGIVPDVSHLSEAGFWDVATLSDHPFIASHSLSRAVHEHPRNLSDAQFREIVRRGGLVGLSFCGGHLGAQRLDSIYRHLSHFLSMDGEKTVALGGDLDGFSLPSSWRGIEFYERLATYLLKKGITEDQLQRLFFQNAFDFFDNTLQSQENAVQ